MNVVSRIYALLSSNQQDCKDWGGVGGLDNPGKDMGGSQRVLLKKMTRHQTHPGWDGMWGDFGSLLHNSTLRIVPWPPTFRRSNRVFLKK